MAQTLELADVVSSAFDVALQGVWTAMPGRIESYDATRQSASIQVTVKSVSISESGSRNADAIAMLHDVPVLHLGGGGFRTTYPVAKGDTALVVFTSRELATWLAHGGVVAPAGDHRHDLSDGVAILGLRDFGRLLVDVPVDRMSIGKAGGATVEITASEVRLGGNVGTQSTLKGPSYNSAVSIWLTALSTYLAAIVAALPAPLPLVVPTATYNAAALALTTAASAALTTVAKVV